MTSAAGFTPSQPKPSVVSRLRNMVFDAVPLGVWVLSIAAVLVLAEDKTRPLDYPGMALVASYSVVSPSRSQVKELLVAEQALVTEGQIVGRLSGDGLELRAQKIQHSIEQIRAEMQRDKELQIATLRQARTEQQSEAITDIRRFARDVENARLDLLEMEARIEENRIRLTGLQIDLEREKGLSAQKLFSEASMIRTRTDHDALAERIRRTEDVIKGRREKLVAVKARLAGYQAGAELTGPDLALVLGPYAWRISVQQDELEAIAMDRTRLILRAPAAGRVERVFAHAGERVGRGEAVLRITDAAPRGMVTYVPENQIQNIRIGMRAIFERSTKPGVIMETKVQSIGTAVVEVPEKCQTIPRVREWRAGVSRGYRRNATGTWRVGAGSDPSHQRDG